MASSQVAGREAASHATASPESCARCAHPGVASHLGYREGGPGVVITGIVLPQQILQVWALKPVKEEMIVEKAASPGEPMATGEGTWACSAAGSLDE